MQEVKYVIDLPDWKRPDRYVHTERVHEMYDADERDDKWLRRLPAEFQLAANPDRSVVRVCAMIVVVVVCSL